MPSVNDQLEVHMDATAEVRETGTKLRIDSDRQWDGQTGDSVLRVRGEKEGGQVFDAAYVEVDTAECEVTAKILREIASPTSDMTDLIAQEVIAAFGSKLSGRDAHQIAAIAQQAWKNHTTPWPAGERQQRVGLLAERFERAAAKRRTAPAYAGSGEGELARN